MFPTKYFQKVLKSSDSPKGPAPPVDEKSLSLPPNGIFRKLPAPQQSGGRYCANLMYQKGYKNVCFSLIEAVTSISHLTS